VKWTASIAAIIAVIIIAVAFYSYFTYGSGVIEIKMTDPQGEWDEATQVYLNCSSIEIHRAQEDNESGWFTVVDKGEWINLTRISDVNQTISHKNLQAGSYNLIRFRIVEAFVTVNGKNYCKNYTATVPNGELKITIIKGGTHVITGQTAALLIQLNAEVKGSEGLGFEIVPEVKAIPV
jgi:hypothetical protein